MENTRRGEIAETASFLIDEHEKRKRELDSLEASGTVVCVDRYSFMPPMGVVTSLFGDHR